MIAYCLFHRAKPACERIGLKCVWTKRSLVFWHSTWAPAVMRYVLTTQSWQMETRQPEFYRQHGAPDAVRLRHGGDSARWQSSTTCRKVIAEHVAFREFQREFEFMVSVELLLLARSS